MASWLFAAAALEAPPSLQHGISLLGQPPSSHHHHLPLPCHRRCSSWQRNGSSARPAWASSTCWPPVGTCKRQPRPGTGPVGLAHPDVNRGPRRPSATASTAAVLFHRFYMAQSFAHFDAQVGAGEPLPPCSLSLSHTHLCLMCRWQTMAQCCLFVACKTQQTANDGHRTQHIKLEQLLKLAHRVRPARPACVGSPTLTCDPSLGPLAPGRQPAP